MGLLLSCVIVTLELGHHTSLRRWVLMVSAVVLAVLLAFINFALVWGLLLALCVIIGIASFMATRGEEGVTVRTLPWTSIAGAVIAALFLFFGSAVNTGLTSVFPVSSLEVRPSFSSSMALASQAHGSSFERTIVGTGPDTFGEAWLLYKPATVNSSDFWSLDFDTGYSTLTTAFLSVGALGALMWLVPLILVCVALLRVVRLRVLSREERVPAVILSASAIFMLLSLIFYSPSQNLMLLGFLLAGAAFGYLWRQGRSVPAEELSRSWYAAGLAGAVVLVLLIAFTSAVIVRRTIAEGFAGQGSVALSNNEYSAALASARQSLSVEKTPDGLLLELSADSGQLQTLIASTTPGPTIQQQFTATLQDAIAAGQTEEALRPHDYRAYSTLGDIYAALVPLNINGAYQSALTSYQAAESRNPTGPQIPLAMARVDAAAGNGASTESDLKAALTLKPDYTDAMLFLVQLAVANNDLNTAVQAASAAAQSAPGVPSIWFELGLLYYSGGDSKDAVAPLKEAVALETDYANAKYFLGLAEYAQGDVGDAIQQFTDLNKSNPGNPDVTSVLANMQAGKSPFGTSTPPTTAPVQQ
jgi:tetratricopeptide (TPR) repeat protein